MEALRRLWGRVKEATLRLLQALIMASRSLGL